MMDDKRLFIKYNSKNTSGYARNEELDKSLFNNKIKEDSYSIDRYISKPWQLLIFTTLKCNCNCIYCINKQFHPYFGDMLMTENIIRQIVWKLGPNLSGCSWHGGEPTLVPENLISALYDEMEKRKIFFHTNAQSNGISFTKEKELFLASKGMHLGISFDGLMTEKQRGKQANDAILKKIDQCRKYGVINVITKLGIDQLVENYEYFKSLGISVLESELVMDSIQYDSGCVIGPNEIYKLVDYINYWIHDTINPIYDRFAQSTISAVVRDNKFIFPRGQAGRIMVIDPRGNIACMGQDIRTDWICNINDIKDYNDIKVHPNYLKIVNMQQEIYNNCVEIDCPYKGICIGGHSELNTQINSLNKNYCECMKVLYQGVIDLIKEINLSKVDQYNPIFIDILKTNNYYPLSECKNIELKYS